MSMLDKLKGLLKGHEDTARQGVEKAGDAFDDRTGNKYQSQVDAAQRKIDEQLGNRPPTDGQP
ncbi:MULTISPECIES: antitoxin [Streptomyces]|uniref:antitoxin n=1 Tax=Streptomyces TaxID=1883 RepID=UPI00163BBDBD|nr:MULTISPECIES: antitoxin [Streptomyces]MBC2874949.1 antitoxin [Streptomyces sp. TYQ1024]UBI37390.1 antitoxin [Streptomyces mobaraensis]UKW29980.1 antitoxin [Streptomyces sp. TYQ1024]